ncbi:MAG: radical SAM protein [Bryobacterales bacterium]|nr:radical SAM protein [Bryobacterales bacterium]
MHRPTKYVEKGLTNVATGMWKFARWMDSRKAVEPSFTPAWTEKPMLKSWEKSKPALGWPRKTDSLCPKCVIDAREKILSGQVDYNVLKSEKVGEVEASIIERDGQVWMVKECPTHGKIEDIMAIDSKFLEHIESQFPGRDIQAHNDEELHNHGSSTVKFGRGAVLTVDLTNRCNMMCDPCFMDANQVGFVHELEWEEIKTILDNAITIKPRRQMSVQFSGGEPTMSPYFLKAVRYARSVGYNSVQAATNGIEFAKSRDFAEAAADAGMRYAYLQFDGIGNARNSHRKIGNLFDVKMKAIDNMHDAGIEIVLVTTIVNNINNEEVGPIIDFARDNPGKIAFVSFQPVSFTGRDEEITDERRMKQRYTLSHLAYDVKGQLGMTEPTRDWFPISVMGTFVDAADLAHGPEAQWGQVSCGCHPNCGVGTAFMINKQTKDMAPVPEFINVPQLTQDIRRINDSGRSKWKTNLQLGLALLKNYNPMKAPEAFSMFDLLKKFDKSFALSGKNYGKGTARRKDPWNFLFVAGMWFQDLFNYDFRRTEMCVIPYGTQEGEISFCAYNTGIGWRNIIEKMHMTATLTTWYDEHGRHKIYAGGKSVDLEDYTHRLKLDPTMVAREEQDFEGPKNAREEKIKQRNQKLAEAQAKGEVPVVNGGASKKKILTTEEEAKLMKMYREQVLKEPPAPKLIQIAGNGGIAPAPAKQEETGVAGD